MHKQHQEASRYPQLVVSLLIKIETEKGIVLIEKYFGEKFVFHFIGVDYPRKVLTRSLTRYCEMISITRKGEAIRLDEEDYTVKPNVKKEDNNEGWRR